MLHVCLVLLAITDGETEDMLLADDKDKIQRKKLDGEIHICTGTIKFHSPVHVEDMTYMRRQVQSS